MLDHAQRALCGALAELLSYPVGDLPGQACAALGLARGTPAAAPLARFAAAAARLAPAAREELYTATFDLEPRCTPYLGHQLLGDGPQRGPFLARLVEVFEAGGHRARAELPDHLAEVLAFLAVAPPSGERDDLVRDGLAPALEKMLAGFEERENPYRDLLVAAQALLREDRPAARSPARQEVRG